MNPFCKKHKPAVLMVSKERNTDLGIDPITKKKMKGRTKFWECSRCGARYRVGGEEIASKNR